MSTKIAKEEINRAVADETSNADDCNNCSGSEDEEDLQVLVATLRASLQKSHPEIDYLYSDNYLASVLSVPGRPFEYARDIKILGALNWRRSYGVEALVTAFKCVSDHADGLPTFQLADTDVVDCNDAQQHDSNDSNSSSRSLPIFVPSQYLVEVCQSGAFCFAGFDEEGRAILHARTALIDWWKTGVEDGIRYHVLVIEHALSQIFKHSENSGMKEEMSSESMMLYVDTSNMRLLPLPPLGSIIGMAKLMQIAYPDRIHQIHIGPVNSLLIKLFEYIAPFLSPRSRDKIVLLDYAPEIKTR